MWDYLGHHRAVDGPGETPERPEEAVLHRQAATAGDADDGRPPPEV